MSTQIEQIEAIHIARAWEGKVSTYAQVERLMETRKRYANFIGRNPSQDEELLEIIDFINDDICKILAIPRIKQFK
jgi:hypothetical protein